ncbi:DUF4331 domain-containing protein [Actinoplanes bogorensis]|uniref:DUF4331 domain-containing protein n=1 Tax=Paractinoplanes bogorensis TaxID=1610840 RepID=A0ABS5YMA0_9ACTN|nr:DUF4331 family protein [Actinoplanes bogorensis]MBU2663873.1 DUF4331 domain-containing protein [Actinoplanes bogorensis]
MSDHFSGPAVMGDPSVDLTDLYAFVSPERPGWLTVVANVFPQATSESLFSDAVDYRVLVRPIAAAGRSFDVTGDSGVTVTARFTPPDDVTGVQAGRIVSSSGAFVDIALGGDPVESGGLRAYAGLRSDPFFMDVIAALQSETEGRLLYAAPGSNALDRFDVLSLVVEVPIDAALGTGLVGVAAEVVSTPGRKPVRIERLGRPEIKNYVLSGSEHDQRFAGLEIRDLYNREDPFAISPVYRTVYESRFDAQLSFLDTLDGSNDWALAPDGAHPLRPLLMADFLVVDPHLPFAPDGYFEIERALLEGRPHRTSGGRWLDDDFFDTFLTIVTTAGRRTLSDGVDGPTVPASHFFPYVVAPNLAVDLPVPALPGS